MTANITVFLLLGFDTIGVLFNMMRREIEVSGVQLFSNIEDV